MKRAYIFNPIIDPHHCFECGGDVEEMHHVVPVVTGGTRVVPLCESCHGKVHQLNREGHSFLIKVALKKKKEKGEAIGAPPYGFLINKDGLLVVNSKEMHIVQYAKKLREEGFTIRAIQKKLYDSKMYNRMGKQFSVAAVHAIVKK